MIKIAICQSRCDLLNTHSNARKIVKTCRTLLLQGVDCVVYPELFLTGYSLGDMYASPVLFARCQNALEEIASAKLACSIVIGTPYEITLNGKRCIYNALVLIKDGSYSFFSAKTFLASGGVFSEHRYFSSYPLSKKKLLVINKQKIGFMICKDGWERESYVHYSNADLIIIVSASPYRIHIHKKRRKIVKKHANSVHKNVLYLNMCGGQNEYAFDGSSFIYNVDTQTVTSLGEWQENTCVVSISDTSQIKEISFSYPQKIKKRGRSEYNHIWNALKETTYNFIRLSGYKKVIINLSGGIDSCLCAYLCSHIFHNENIYALVMPSMYNSRRTKKIAQKIIQDLCLQSLEISISEMYSYFLRSIRSNTKINTTTQNIQSRIRCLVAMYYSQELSALVIGTTNRSEASVGYTTLYGDMIGAFNPLKDLYKQDVYAIARWYSQNYTPPLPRDVIDIPPSAELDFNQRDSNDLMSYDELDPILKNILDVPDTKVKIKNTKEMFSNEKYNAIYQLVMKNEFKRRQAPPGTILRDTSFISGRSYPIAYNILK